MGLEKLDTNKQIHQKINGVSVMVRITEQILEEGKSSKGSWSKKQLQVLGTTAYLNKGWKERLIGLNVPNF